MKKNIDFGNGKIWKIIIAQAIPLTLAQLVQLAYNLVDRIYIGHIGDGSGIEFTGVGVTFPILTLIMAFTSFFGMGGLPLFSMARGEGRDSHAEKILGNSFTLLAIASVILMAAGLIFCKPLLYLFGASAETCPYAEQYLKIYLLGTPFSMLSTGLNCYINAQGFPKKGMCTVLLGAIINIILDPIFIFKLELGVSGAAIATVISQIISAIWVLSFLTGENAILKIKKENLRLDISIIKNILKLGVVNFVMQGSTCLVQAVSNSTLQSFGGDIYVGLMTIINSVREILMLPVSGIFSGSQPVLSFNYGAKKYKRVIEGIRFNTVLSGGYLLIMWGLVFAFPAFWIQIFGGNEKRIALGTSVMRSYFFGFVFMAFQFVGQSTFQAVGDAKHAIIFSLLRKVIIVLPLTLILPHCFNLGVNGVFFAEPVSNVVGGLASYITMRLTIYRKLKRGESEENGTST